MSDANKLPPAQPAYILRGHAAQIHALHFVSARIRLVTADADGWVIVWNLAIKRPVAAWKAHNNAVLALGSWGPDRIITHGRDNQLLVWQLSLADEASMDRILPIDITDTKPRHPWLLHALPVNALNFCSFAMCHDGIPRCTSSSKLVESGAAVGPILLAVPNAIDNGGIDIFELPTQRRAAMIPSDRGINTGMVMALNILAETTRIHVIAGYESGHTMVFVQPDPGASFERLYSSQAHTQPVLSLSISPAKDHYITSSADANIIKHPLPSTRGIFKQNLKPLKVVATRHAGQQGLSYRSDGRIFATAGWDSAVRVYSGKTLKEVAVLKWHKEGCYVTAFNSIDQSCEMGKSTDSTSSTCHNDTSTATSESYHTNNNVNVNVNDIGTPSNDSDLIRPHHANTSNNSMTVSQLRDRKAQQTHWLAAGSKDGKISLWDIY